jgi:hypothetical protein
MGCIFTEIGSNACKLRVGMKISDNYQPVRKHLTVYGSISGNYAFRGEKTIWHESALERDFLIKQDFNDAVLDVVSQPVEIPYVTARGNSSTYTPDFLIQFSSNGYFLPDFTPKPILAEIKPSKIIRRDWDKLKPKFKAAMAFAKEQDWIFHIYDEQKIHDQYFKNIEFLKRFRRSSFPEDESLRILETLKLLGHCPLNQLPAHIYKAENNVLMGISHVWSLIAKKQIACDLTQPLVQDTLVWINDNRALYMGDV